MFKHFSRDYPGIRCIGSLALLPPRNFSGFESYSVYNISFNISKELKSSLIIKFYKLFKLLGSSVI